MRLIRLRQLSLFRNTTMLNTFLRGYNDIKFEDIPVVSPGIIKKALNTHGIAFEEGYTCFVSKCFTCTNIKDADKSVPKLYINKTTGMYMCSLCSHSGQWDQFQARLQMKSRRSKAKTVFQEDFQRLQKITQTIAEIRDSTEELSKLSEEELSNLITKFKIPVMSQTVANLMNIRVNTKNTLLYFPLENVDNKIVGYRTLHSINSNENTLPDLQCGGLLTCKSMRNKETALIVPDIKDLLVLVDYKINASVVCLPEGVRSLSQFVLPSLERFKKVILWLGSDNASWSSAKHFAQKLNAKRCALIRPSELLPHLNPRQDFKSIVNAAQPLWHKSITTFGSLRAEVLSDLQNIDKVQGVKWKRYPTLNKILRGHRRGELTVLTGPTGCGKTTFVSDYSLDLALQGVNTLWGSFEIRNARLARTMLQQMAGFNLEENLERFDEMADAFEKLPVFFMTFHGQQSIKVVMEAVEHATYVHDIAHLIIDNVQFMMGMSEDEKHMDRFWKQDAIIAAFRTFATRKNCHVTLVIHPRKERNEEDLTTNSIFGGAKVSQEADNVLIIQDKRLTSVKGKKYLQVTKNRYSGDLGIMALDFDKKSLSYGQKKPKIAQNAEGVEKSQTKETPAN